MNVNKFITPMVGLIIAVVLVAGLMVPVISSLDNGGGSSEGDTHTNVGDAYYVTATSSSNAVIYPVSDASVSASQSGTDPWETALMPWGGIVAFGEDWVAYSDENGMCVQSLYGGTTTGNYARIEGNVFTLSGGKGDAPFEGLLLYSSPSGDYVNPAGQMYISDSTVLYALGSLVYTEPPDRYSNGFVLTIGSVSENQAIIQDLQTDDTAVSVATFTVADNSIESMNVQISGNDVTFTSSSETSYLSLVVPVTVEGSGSDSDGSGLSPTLSTLLSVIPLITVVGIVIGAIGFLRMRN